LRDLWGRISDSPCPRWSSRPPRRLLSIERLEDRTMLSTIHTVSVTGTPATSVEFGVRTGTVTPTDIYLRTSGGQAQWSDDNGSTWQSIQDDTSGTVLSLAGPGATNTFTFKTTSAVHLQGFTGKGGNLVFGGGDFVTAGAVLDGFIGPSDVTID